MKRTLAIVAVLALFVPVAVHASTVKVSSMGTYYLTGTISVPASSGYSALNESAYIGQVAITLDGHNYTGYCVDLFTSFYLGDSWTATERKMSDLPIGTAGQASTDPAWAAAGVGGHAAWIVDNYAPTVDSAVDAAALQLAVWLTLYPHVTTSDFTFSSHTADIRTLALQWYTQGQSHSADAIWLDGTGSCRHQDFVIPESLPVPEPASMVLLGTGLIGVAGAVRKKMLGRKSR